MRKLFMIGLGVTCDRLRLEAKFLNLSHTAEIRPDKTKGKAVSFFLLFCLFFFFPFFQAERCREMRSSVPLFLAKRKNH